MRSREIASSPRPPPPPGVPLPSSHSGWWLCSLCRKPLDGLMLPGTFPLMQPHPCVNIPYLPCFRASAGPTFSLTSPNPSNPSTHSLHSLRSLVSPPTRCLCIWINSCKCVADQPRKYLLTTPTLVIFSKIERNSCLYHSYRANANVTFVYEYESHDSRVINSACYCFSLRKRKS